MSINYCNDWSDWYHRNWREFTFIEIHHEVSIMGNHYTHLALLGFHLFIDWGER